MATAHLPELVRTHIFDHPEGWWRMMMFCYLGEILKTLRTFLKVLGGIVVGSWVLAGPLNQRFASSPLLGLVAVIGAAVLVAACARWFRRRVVRRAGGEPGSRDEPAPTPETQGSQR